MKRKWLIGLLSIFMVLAMCFGFAACGGDEGGDKGGEDGGTTQTTDQATADAAIASLKTLYKDGETASAYKVLGQTKVNGTNYTITWTVTSDDVTNITDYVQIGTMDDTTKQITIDIVKGENKITYKLKATVTVGTASASLEVTKTIPAKPRDAKGTEDDPYSVGKAMEVAESIGTVGSYYYAEADKGKEVPTRVWVTGYVVDTGNPTYFGTSAVGWVYIADEYDPDKTYDNTNSLCIFRIEYDNVLKSASDLWLGGKITVNGHLEWYQDKNNSSPYAELASFTKSDKTYSSVYCNYLQPQDLTPVQRAQKALDSVEDTMTVAKAGDVTLPTSTVEGVTFAWESDNTTYTVEGSKLKVADLPEELTTVNLTVTATCEGQTAHKTVKVTIKPLVVIANGLYFDFAVATGSGTGLNNDSALQLFQNACSTASTELVSVTPTKVYDGNGSGGAKSDAKGLLKLGTSSDAGKLVLTFSKTVVKVVINCHDFYAPSTTNPTNSNKISVNNSADELLPYVENAVGTDKTFEINPSKTVTIDFKNRGCIYSISIYFGEDTRSAQEKVTAALAAVEASYNVTTAGDYTLPTPTVDGVTFTWAKKTGDYNVTNGTVLAIGTELPDEACDVVLTLTAKYGTETVTDNTKEVTFHIKAKSTTPTPTGDVVLDGEGLAEALSGKTGYQTGTYTVNGVSVQITDVMSNTDLYDSSKTDSSDKYTDTGMTFLQFKNGSGKLTLKGTFTEITVVKLTNASYADAKTLPVTVGGTALTEKSHEEASANLTIAGSAYYLYTIVYEVTTTGEQTVEFGTPNGAVYIPSITLKGTASGGTQGGGSQGGGGSETPTGTFTPLTEAKTGTFKFALYYGTDKSYYYATGAMSGYYFATSTNLSEAADFVIESVGENQYTIKVGGKYLEFAPRTGKNSKDETKNNEGVNIEMNATQTEGKYWQWVEGIQNFVMESTYNKTGDESATDLYYFGNYGTYTSMGGNYIGRIATGSDGSYTLKSNVEGVTQWVAHFGTLEESSEGGDTQTAQEKVTAALAAVQSEYTVTVAEDYMLPAPTVEGVTFSWVSDNETYKITNGNALAIGEELPAEACDVTLTLTVTCGKEEVTNNTKTVTIHINAKSTTPETGTKLTLTSSFFGDKSGSYDAYNGEYTYAESYTVATTQVMKQTFGTESVLQFQAQKGILSIAGTFTKVELTYLSTFKYASMNKPEVNYGGTVLTAKADSSDVDTGEKDGTDASAKTIYRHVESYAISDSASVKLLKVDYTKQSGTLRLSQIVITTTEGAAGHIHTCGNPTQKEPADNVYHTISCSCGYTKDEAHVYSGDDDTLCDKCNYERTIDNSVWTRVDNVSTLTEGAKIVLVYVVSDSVVAVNGTSKDKKYLTYETGVVLSDEGKTAKLPATAQELTLGKDGDNWTLSIDGKMLGLTGTSNGKLMFEEDKGTATSFTTTWTISIDENSVAQIASTLGTSSKPCRLQCNTSSGSERFTNYETAKQKDPTIYIKSTPSA